MKKIITLSGVSVANDALPRVSATTAERTLASIPNLFLWMQGGSKYQVSAAELRDRANGHAITSAASSEYLWSQGTFTGGQPALVGVDASSANYEVPAGVELDPNRWSVAAVLSIPSTVVGANNGLIGLPYNHVEPMIGLRLSFNPANNLRLYGTTASEYRIEYSGAQWTDQPALLVLTFSTENGLVLRVNGVVVDTNSADKRPLTETQFHIGQSTPLPNHSNTFAGQLGHLLMFNSDLSAVENAGYLAALEAALMDFYGIS